MNLHASREMAPATLGIGFYGAVEVARLLAIPPRNVRRWLGGYTYEDENRKVSMPPLWVPQLPRVDGMLELGFRDLIELKFVKAFMNAGLTLNAIRRCMAAAKEMIEDERPFSTRRFRTDGRSIFFEIAGGAEQGQLIDLRTRQYQMGSVIERTFRDLDVEDDFVARWRPHNGKASIVLDPTRAFGRPIVADFGVPTEVLADAVTAEGSIDAAAHAFEVPASVVRDAVSFEARLNAT